jgi:hypothetical protein
MTEISGQNIKQAHAECEEFADFGLTPSTGLKHIRSRAMDFANENAESAFTFAGKLCNAKTAQEILALQTQFAQDRMQTLLTNTQALQRLIWESGE